mgnify:CR=1 FL=1
MSLGRTVGISASATDSDGVDSVAGTPLSAMAAVSAERETTAVDLDCCRDIDAGANAVAGERRRPIAAAVARVIESRMVDVRVSEM